MATNLDDRTLVKNAAVSYLGDIRAKLQGALDGNGHSPWSEGHLRTIIRETIELADEAIDNLED